MIMTTRTITKRRTITIITLVRAMIMTTTTTIGSLRSYDGNCKENVSLKLNFALS